MAASAELSQAPPKAAWRSCWGRLHCFSHRKNRKPNHHHHHHRLLSASPPSSSSSSSSSTTSCPAIASAIPAPAPPPAVLPIAANSFSSSTSASSPFVLVPPPSPSPSLQQKPSLAMAATSSSCSPSCVPASVYSSAMNSRPFFFDSVLVTPPLNSTFTTEPTTPLSTAPFTPPPELAHLTTPPSPELPFAELFAADQKVNGDLHHFRSSSNSNLDLVYRLYPVSAMANADTQENVSSEENNYSPLPQRVAFFEKTMLMDPSATRVAFSEKNILVDSARTDHHTSSNSLQETDVLLHPSSADLCNAKLFSESLRLSADLASSERDSAGNFSNLCPNEVFFHQKHPFMEPSYEYSSSIVHKNDSTVLPLEFSEDQRIKKPLSENPWKLLYSEIETVENCSSLCPNEEFPQKKTKKQAFMEPSHEDSISSSVPEGLSKALEEDQSADKTPSEKPWKLRNDSREESGSGTSAQSEEEEDDDDEEEEQKSEMEGNINTHSSVRALDGFIDSVITETRDDGDGEEDCPESNVMATKQCRELSEGSPDQTKDMANIAIQNKENSIDRERRFKQIIHWLQIEAKSQAESIFRLSEELSWQEAAFLDLQEQRLADLGIDLHSVNRELSSTEVS